MTERAKISIVFWGIVLIGFPVALTVATGIGWLVFCALEWIMQIK
jgi:hypothetical protein